MGAVNARKKYILTNIHFATADHNLTTDVASVFIQNFKIASIAAQNRHITCENCRQIFQNVNFGYFVICSESSVCYLCNLFELLIL